MFVDLFGCVWFFVGYLFWWFLFCCGFFGAVGFGFCVIADVGVGGWVGFGGWCFAVSF